MDEKSRSVCDKVHFNPLFDSYSESLRNFMYYRCGDMQQADDLTQDAFIKLWNNCKKVIYEKAKAFLFAVAKNKFLNEVAHKKVVLHYVQTFQSNQSVETPQEVLEGNEFMERLQHAINQLPQGQREVFLLNRIDKKTYVEIAAMLGVSQTAVEKKMQKALLKIRKIVKNV